MIDTNIPKHTLISYSRKKNGEPMGVLVAVPMNSHGGFNIGYSQCRKTDKFNKSLGLKIAIGRAEFDTDYRSLDNIPHNLRKMLPSFVQRCERYYKEN